MKLNRKKLQKFAKEPKRWQKFSLFRVRFRTFSFYCFFVTFVVVDLLMMTKLAMMATSVFLLAATKTELCAHEVTKRIRSI